MKHLLLLTLLIGSLTAYCQDTTRTPIGYEIDYPHLYVLVDTVHNMAHVHSIYPHKVFISINGGRALEVKRGGVLTVWSNRFTVTVTRKRYRRIYQF